MGLVTSVLITSPRVERLPQTGGGGASAFLLEDGTSFLLLEDGASNLLLE